MIKAGFVFFILFLSIAINMPQSLIARFGFDANYLLAALLAVVITGLIMHRSLFLIVLVVLCALLVNLPTEVLDSWGIERDYILATLVTLVIVPVGAKISGKF